MRILAGDVGGTKSELALYERGATGPWQERASTRLASAEHRSVLDLVRAFLGPDAPAIDTVGLAVAGPVHDGRCRITNLGWDLDARDLSRTLGAPVSIENDFAAGARGIFEHSTLGDPVVLQEGDSAPDGPTAFIGAGTGLGHAVAVSTRDSFHVLPGEGGHTDFAPRDDVEVALWRFLRAKYGAPVSIERVVSGPGIADLWAFAVAEGLDADSASVRAEMTTDDPAAVVTRHALAGTDAACARALSMFLSLYGSEAGNFALKVIPSGGLYVTGGIAPRIVDRLREGGEFMRSFLAKDRMRDTLSRIPVQIVMNTRLALFGARALATEALRRERG